MPTLKRDREAMDDEGARKKMKTSPVDDTPTIRPIMDLTADEPQTIPGAQVPPSQELQVRTASLVLLSHTNKPSQRL